MKLDLELTFGPYRPQNQKTAQLYPKIVDAVKSLAYLIEDICPESREKSVAFTKLQEAKMWANAAIALHTPIEKG